MTVTLVPLSQFSDYHKKGWRIVPGYDLKAGDYAATMMSPGHKLVRPMKEVRKEISARASAVFVENCRKRREAKDRSPENNPMADCA